MELLVLLALALVIWQTAGLVRLKPFNRWLAVVFFGWWTFTLVWNASIALRKSNAKLLPAIALLSLFIGLNLFSAFYLSRRRFREFAAQFQQEQHSRIMQKISQKKLLKDLKR